MIIDFSQILLIFSLTLNLRTAFHRLGKNRFGMLVSIQTQQVFNPICLFPEYSTLTSLQLILSFIDIAIRYRYPSLAREKNWKMIFFSFIVGIRKVKKIFHSFRKFSLILYNQGYSIHDIAISIVFERARCVKSSLTRDFNPYLVLYCSKL